MAVLKSAMDDLILASGRAHKEFISNNSAGPFVFVCSILRLVGFCVIFTNQFSASDRAFGLVCVCVCLSLGQGSNF